MHRFCCPDAVRDGDQVRIEGAVAVQIRRVLRLSPGDQIVLFGLDEWEYTVRLERVERDTAQGRLVARDSPTAEPFCRLTLALALLKGEKCEWVLQKGTELGVASFLLMQTHRTIPLPDSNRRAARWERYARVVREATEQCGRVATPPVEGPLSFPQCIERQADLAVICHEGAETRLSDLLAPVRQRPTDGANRESNRTRSALLLVGPEGGFSDEEIGQAVAIDIRPASLGRRVLRAETAALAAVTLAIDALEP